MSQKLDGGEKREIMFKRLLKPFNWLRSNEDAIIDSIQTLVVGGLFLLIGIYVYSTVQQAMPAITNPTLNASGNQTTTNIAAAFNLMTVTFIVIAAAAILGILVGAFMYRKWGGGEI